MTMDRLVKGATDKIRQAGSGMPAILIRQLENLGKLMRVMPSPELRAVVETHARSILRAGDATVRDEADRADIEVAFDRTMSGIDLGVSASDSSEWLTSAAADQDMVPRPAHRR
jgi:uncharacterized membrane protein